MIRIGRGIRWYNDFYDEVMNMCLRKLFALQNRKTKG
jgi:hypothetical protein